ncbi:MAG TPA: diaminopimelate decarboxylase [Pseudogracilibacillus sp.]|nr:diaminopimelate decarboxylase [Pseudogracilibacillus sp.]
MVIENHPHKVNKKNHLTIGGLDTVEIAKEYGTPLYVYDVELVRKNARMYVDAFKQAGVKAQVAYASKAFSSIAILEVINQENLSLDIVSEGELYTAIKAGFPPEKIHFHGNNKNRKELEAAIDANIGCIIIDNFDEINLLETILKEKNREIDVLIRITPGIESETHKFIMTGNEDSKFGFNLQNGQADQVFEILKNHPTIHLIGVHSHIGSQIFSEESFLLAVEALFNLIEQWFERDEFIPKVMNFGGGFGIRYTKEDTPIPYNKYVEAIVKATKEKTLEIGIPMPEIWIEPGRSIVGEAGISLYQVGSQKTIEGVRKYISVDGGMNDNIRPALYDAKYEAVLANRVQAEEKEEVSIAGKCCESGDMLIWDLYLPKSYPGDYLAMFSTGAYGYSMASNYNRFSKPAVVFVEKGESHLVIRRESNEDIIKNDLSYLE